MTDASNGVDLAGVIAGALTIIGILFANKEGSREGNNIAEEIKSDKTIHAVGAGIVDRETAKFIVDTLVRISYLLEKLVSVTEAKGETERSQHLREDLKGDLQKIIEQMRTEK